MFLKNQFNLALNPKLYRIFLLLILFTASFNIFYNLGNVPIDSWDEARHGISAYEMIKNRDFIVNTYAFSNDYWNLKPPLSLWAIIMGYKMAGFNPLGLRLFSGVAALLTILFIALYTKLRYGRLASLISALVLATSTQYILSHSARTGDADSLHVLFFTVAMLSTALISTSKTWLYIAGLSFSLSFITKSWHALNIAVIIFLFILFSGSLFKIRIKEWLMFLASATFPIFTWAAIRFSKDGLTFFKAMVNYDLLARSSRTLEGHTGSPRYYLLTLEYSFTCWAIVLIVCLLVYLFNLAGKKDKKPDKPFLLLALWIIVPLVFYSLAKTKITWYILPIYPALAICTGALSSKVLSGSSNFFLKLVIIASILVSLFTYEKIIIKNISKVKPDSNQATLQQMKGHGDYKGANIYTMGINKDYPTCWRQCDLLAAELYGDLRPMDGGLDSFLKDNGNSLIIVPNSDKYRDMIKNRNLKTIVQDKENCILTK